MAKTKRNSDRITSFAAIIVAVAAIAVSLWQGIDNRRHNRLSVKPKLQIVFRADPQGDAEIILRNDGLGPASIRNFEVKLDNKLLDKVSLSAIFELVRIMELDSVPFTFDPIVNTTTIRAGDQANILVFKYDESIDMPSIVRILREHVNRLDLYIEYESMYGEKFTINF